MEGERHQLEEQGTLKEVKKTNNTTQNDAIYQMSSRAYRTYIISFTCHLVATFFSPYIFMKIKVTRTHHNKMKNINTWI